MTIEEGDLEVLLGILNDEDSFNWAVSAVELRGKQATVRIDRFDFDDWELKNATASVTIRCDDVVEVRAELGGFGGAGWHTEHPVLWKHNRQHASLYFTSAPANAFETVGRLWHAHQKLYGSYRAMAEHLNLEVGGNLESLLLSGHGMLATGPRHAIDHYMNAIGDQMRMNVLASYDPGGNYKMLDFHEGCFVVCGEAKVADLANFK